MRARCRRSRWQGASALLKSSTDELTRPLQIAAATKKVKTVIVAVVVIIVVVIIKIVQSVKLFLVVTTIILPFRRSRGGMGALALLFLLQLLPRPLVRRQEPQSICTTQSSQHPDQRIGIPLRVRRRMRENVLPLLELGIPLEEVSIQQAHAGQKLARRHALQIRVDLLGLLVRHRL